jgi:hypothetical protein
MPLLETGDYLLRAMIAVGCGCVDVDLIHRQVELQDVVVCETKHTL